MRRRGGPPYRPARDGISGADWLRRRPDPPTKADSVVSVAGETEIIGAGDHRHGGDPSAGAPAYCFRRFSSKARVRVKLR